MQQIPKTLAEVEEIEKTPWQDRLMAGNVYEAIGKSARAWPDRPAIHALAHGQLDDTPETISYRDLFARITSAANLLRDLGVGDTDVTTLLMPIIPETQYFLWGAETAGISNPVNPFLEVEHIIGICKAAGTKVLVACDPSISPDPWPKAEAVKAAMPDITLIRVGGPARSTEDVVSYEDAIQGVADDRLTFDRTFHLDDVAAYFHTGGTTGVPKLARHTQRGLMLHSWTFGNCIPDPVDPSHAPQHYPLGIPLFHVGGGTCYSLMPFVWGRTVTMMGAEGYRNPNTLRDFYANCARLGWTKIPIVPTVWSMLLQMPVEGYDLSRVQHGGVGGSTLSVEVANAAKRKLGIPLVEGWGMTETHGFATINPYLGDIRVGSVGLRQPYMQVRVVHPDGKGGISGDCETDEIGLVVVRGPQVFGGYLDDDHDAKAWLDGDRNSGWFDTGDLGRLDADGYLWLTGRAKDLIIRGGHNIDPATIEDVLYQHPAIELAAAVGRPDRRVGEIPVAYVQFSAGKTETPENLKTFVAERIPERAANPVEIIPMAELPLTGVGKIFKPELRLDAARRVYEREFAPLAKDLGVTIDTDVRSDKLYGTIVVATIGGTGDREAAAAQVRQAMGAYEIRSEVVVSPD
ncbi:MAG: acyl-CoA synthetase [Minwuia sp.]|nr:acyl-CoA synthetase [Minwuia sp.]